MDINVHIRAFPRNVEFHQVDISQGFPFESSSFDVVHARLVMMHVCDLSATRSKFTLIIPTRRYRSRSRSLSAPSIS